MRISRPITIVVSLILFTGVYYLFSDSSLTPASMNKKEAPLAKDSPVDTNPQPEEVQPVEKTKEAILREVPSEAKKIFSEARASAISKNYRLTSEHLHNAYKLSPELIDITLQDQAFRNYRHEDDFRKLLNIYGRDSFVDLGEGPIILPR